MQAVTKPILGVKRQGRVCTVFVDPVSDQPQSISSFEGLDTAFPVVMQQDEVLGRYGSRYQIRFIDPPNQGTPPEADAHIDETALNQVLEAGDKAAEAYRKQHGIKGGDGRSERLQMLQGGAPAPQVVTPTLVAPVANTPGPSSPVSTNDLVARVFQELETLFAKRSVASGKMLKELNSEIQFVGNFICRVAPEMKAPLLQLSERHKQQERVEF